MARRQVLSVIEQVRSVAGPESRFAALPSARRGRWRRRGSGGRSRRLARAGIGRVRRLARDRVPASSRRLRRRRARPVPEESERFLGLHLDPDETYDWGWSEVHRLLGEMKDTAAEIDPDLNIDEVIDLLDTDPGRSAPDHDAFADFVRDIQAHAVERLDGSAFDVPPPMCDVTVNLAPPGGALGAWYRGTVRGLSNAPDRSGTPSARGPGSRTGRRSPPPITRASPGITSRSGIAVLQREKLSRFHRLFVWYPGSGEGWALYAERLMEELGFFENPEYRLGLLASQLFRSTRVVVDIGAHLEKRIPDDAPLHPGRGVELRPRRGLHGEDRQAAPRPGRVGGVAVSRLARSGHLVQGRGAGDPRHPEAGDEPRPVPLRRARTSTVDCSRQVRSDSIISAR